MKIIGGIYKRLTLDSIEGIEIRPTPAIVREAVFDILGPKVVDSCFLDMFAGTGAVGIEAISRGAKQVTFVECNKNAIRLIKINLEKLNNYQKDIFNIIHKNCTHAIELFEIENKKYDIIFLDPPYNIEYANQILKKIDNGHILAKEGIVIIQYSKKDDLIGNFNSLKLMKEKKYGNTKIKLYSVWWRSKSGRIRIC